MLEDLTCSHYATEIAPGKSVTPHYHRQGNEVYIIFSGMGVIRTWQPNIAADVAEAQVEHGMCSIFHRARSINWSIPVRSHWSFCSRARPNTWAPTVRCRWLFA